MSDEERKKREYALMLIGVGLGQYAERYRRDRWKRKLKDALWPLI